VAIPAAAKRFQMLSLDHIKKKNRVPAIWSQRFLLRTLLAGLLHNCSLKILTVLRDLNVFWRARAHN